MPKTVVFQQTWMCPTGLGKAAFTIEMLEAAGACRSQGPEESVCGKHGLQRVRATLAADLASEIIIGEEEIEPEIEREDAERGRKGQPAQTGAEKTAYRARRQQDIALAIVEARKREHKP